MICTTYFLTFFSELIPPTGYILSSLTNFSSFRVVVFLSFSVLAQKNNKSHERYREKMSSVRTKIL